MREPHFQPFVGSQERRRFILRIEDTDLERSEPRHQVALTGELRWLGLDWDEGPDVGGPSAPYTQAARSAFYQGCSPVWKAKATLCVLFARPKSWIIPKTAAHGRQAPRYAGTCRELTAAAACRSGGAGVEAVAAIRVPAGVVIEFIDAVHGPQTFSSSDIGDFIIRREDGTAASSFAMPSMIRHGVTQVLRGG